ncbi:hypothetical protein LTR05_001082 [Lithohypha guttulata]|uniref:Complex 1 LYR protein domain-containing protein n=1 Tax=Lithohypha guttulata TaxID=1690604 RepID=A0AAN7T7D4_9EURO|nr:hypothetical protein LTR05_001082 [Lithohypha guttulata]
MRGIVHPSRSEGHKLACLSLYRNLLRQALRLHDETTSEYLKSLVQNRFRLDRRINSPSAICHALEQVREVHKIVKDAADGCLENQLRLVDALSRVAIHAQEQDTLRSHQANLRSPTRTSKLAKIAHHENHRSKEWAAKIPKSIPILQRPVPKEQLPNPDRPRRVPVVMSSQGFPFLRYKSGSQSLELGRIMRDQYERDFRRWTTVQNLQHELDHARLEDSWDKDLEKHAGHYNNDDVRWTEAITFADAELRGVLRQAARRRDDIAMRMWHIKEEETQLAAKEKEERRVQRRLEREQQSRSTLVAAGNETTAGIARKGQANHDSSAGSEPTIDADTK